MARQLRPDMLAVHPGKRTGRAPLGGTAGLLLEGKAEPRVLHRAFGSRYSLAGARAMTASSLTLTRAAWADHAIRMGNEYPCSFATEAIPQSNEPR
jgi:hypothetical protein